MAMRSWRDTQQTHAGEHPRLALARALSEKSPSEQVFWEILGALIERPSDRLPPWPDEATLREAVVQIDALLEATWPWEMRAWHSVPCFLQQRDRVHPAAQLLRSLTLARRSEGRSPNLELQAQELRGLRSLTLSRLEFTVRLSDKPHLANLQELSLYDVTIPANEWAAMSESAHLATLRSLAMVDYHLPPDTLAAVLNGCLTRNVRSLGLRSGTIPGARLAELLSHRATLVRIESLDLSGNDLHDWHLGPLMEATWLSNLGELDLRCRNLRYISPEAQERLRKCPQFARTRIHFDPPKR